MSSAQTSNHQLGLSKSLEFCVCLTTPFLRKDIRRQHNSYTRIKLSKKVVFFILLFFFLRGMGEIAIDIHIQRVYIGGPAFSINSQNADVWPEAHAPKCVVNR